MLRGILRELGVTNVYDAATPEAGFEEFNLQGPDVVLVDWSPDFDGIGLLSKIRNDPESKSPYVPVIMVTAERRRPMILEALEAGASDYVIKPFIPDVLKQRIEKTLMPGTTTESDATRLRDDEFRGDLRMMKPPEVVQFISLALQSGLLQILSGESTCEVFFRKGQIIAASGPGTQDEPAVYQMLKVDSGTFQFKIDVPSPPQLIHQQTSMLLLEGLRRVDEEQKG